MNKALAVTLILSALIGAFLLLGAIYQISELLQEDITEEVEINSPKVEIKTLEQLENEGINFDGKG